MTLEEMIENDLKLDKTQLATEAAENPIRHFKYLRMRKEKKTQLKLLENRLKRIRSERFLFYIGKHPDEVCDTIYEKSEVKTVLEGDKDILKIEAEIHVLQQQVEMLDEVLKIFINRGFAIKNIIDVRKLEEGVV